MSYRSIYQATVDVVTRHPGVRVHVGPPREQDNQRALVIQSASWPRRVLVDERLLAYLIVDERPVQEAVLSVARDLFQ